MPLVLGIYVCTLPIVGYVNKNAQIEIMTLVSLNVNFKLFEVMQDMLQM